MPDLDLALFVKAQACFAFSSVNAKPDADLVAASHRFFQVHDRVIRAYIHRMGVRGLDADEIHAEVCWKIAKGLPSFRLK